MADVVTHHMADTERKSAEAPDKRLAMFAGIIVFLVLIPFWLFLYTMTPEGDAQPGAPLMAVIFVAGVRLVWILGSSERHLYEMVFWLFVYVFLGVAPFVQARLGLEPDTTDHLSGAHFDDALLVVVVGCIAWIVGSTLAARRPLSTASSFVSRISPARSQAFFAGTLVVTIYYVLSVGPAVLFQSREALELAQFTAWTNPALANLITTAVPMALAVAYVAQVQAIAQPATRSTPGSKALVFLNVVVMFVVVNPISSPRYVFGTVLLAVVATAGAYATLARFRAVTFGTVLSLIFLFPVADMFRRLSGDETLSFDPVRAMLTGDFDSFAQIMNATEYVDELGTRSGHQLLGALLFWVPRSIWAQKPEATGIVLAHYKGYWFDNLSAPIWAEFFIDGGWVLLVLGMFFLGYFFRFVDRRTEIRLRVHRMPSVLGCITPFFLLLVWRGSLMVTIAGLLVLVVSTMLVTARDQGDAAPSSVPSRDGWPPVLEAQAPSQGGWR
ncbi:O-antigen polysaccharide polymerase Wzy [Kocuria rosea]|uniref:O-antigen polysaccharide polymerase Wzy n=1 Tax=Kocuria rosea TaxID=1275 RepID=UPI0012F8FE05|nr:O-antigen polysaccharide polymerase Wzy [Kocuria polaris]